MIWKRRRKKVAYVSNPKAGRHTTRAGLGRVIGSILANLPQHQVFSTETLEQVEGAVREINDGGGTEILALDGGDGTLHVTLTRFLNGCDIGSGETLPSILYLPTGTMRIVASSLGLLRHRPDVLAKRVVRKIQEGSPLDYVHVHALRINGEYGFLYGAGVPVRYLERYYEGGDRLGPRRAAQVFLEVLKNEALGLLPCRKSGKILTKPIYGKITLPEGHDPPVAKFMEHTAVIVTSVEEIGLGCRAMPHARQRPGHFMVRSTQLSYWGLVSNIAQLWAGLPLMNTFDAVVPRLIIRWEKPTVTQVDGEIKEPRMEDVIECGPALRFIVG